MQVPALIYGLYPEVERRARGTFITKLKRGASFEEAINADHIIDTAEHDGLFNLNHGDSDLGDRPHYHVIYVLLALMGAVANGRLPQELKETVFHACLGSSWGVLLLLPHSLTRWVRPEHHWLPFLRAAAQFWPILDAEGARYTYGDVFGSSLQDSVTAVDYVLHNANIFRGGIGQPRPANWPALVEAYAERQARQLH
jgi:hypothetical protein